MVSFQRYGWFSNTEICSVTFQAPLASCIILGEHNMEVNGEKQIVDSTPIHVPPPTNYQSEKFSDPCKDQSTLLTGKSLVSSSTNAQDEMIRYANVASNSNLTEPSDAVANISWEQRESEDDTVMMPLEVAVIFSPTTPSPTATCSSHYHLLITCSSNSVIHCPVVLSTLGLK